MRYDEAARRHFDDAELLEQHERRPNADHHYGIAAECALLGVLKCSPTAQSLFGPDGDVQERYRKHIHVLWTSFMFEATRYRLGTAYSKLMAAFPEGARSRRWRNPFQGWSPDQRYLSNGAVDEEVTPETLSMHKRAARACLQLLDDMGPRSRV